MIVTFLMVSTSSITVQSLRKIILRAPAVGAKIWCLYVYDCATQICISRTYYGNVASWLAGWLGVCLSQPVLYQND